MLICCPACKKENTDAESCSRCQCSLTDLIRVMRGAEEHLGLGRGSLEQGDWEQALWHAERSWELRHNQETAALACLASVGTGDWQRLVLWRSRSQS